MTISMKMIMMITMIYMTIRELPVNIMRRIRGSPHMKKLILITGMLMLAKKVKVTCDKPIDDKQLI